MYRQSDLLKMDDRYAERRREFEVRFNRYSRIADSVERFVSPSGLYELETSHYTGGREVGWQLSRGIVSIASTGEILADVKRNIIHFWHRWIEHPNGNEYLLCGEDYQGYSVVNLSDKTYKAFFPEEGFAGVGFCWTDVLPSPDNLLLAVDGCVWAAPYEIVFYDFRTPDILPYKDLGRVGPLVDSVGWLNNDTFVLTREVEIRKYDGFPYDQLSETEQNALDADESLVDYRIETINAKRPVIEADDTVRAFRRQ